MGEYSPANDSGDGTTRIIHRPLSLHNDQGAVEPIAYPKKLRGCDVVFNELSRTVAIRLCDQERGVYTLTV